MKFLLKGVITLLSLSLLVLPTTVFAKESIGSIVALNGTVSVMRDGKLKQVFLRDEILTGDTLITGANKANLRLWLNDDTSITIAPDSEFKINAYVDERKKSKIETTLMRGSVKIYSGDMVNKYPNSFTLKSPHGLVYLRHGIASVKVNSAITTVFAENTPNEDVLFNDKPVPSGYKASITSRHLIPDVQPISQFDRELLAMSFGNKSLQELRESLFLEGYSSNEFTDFRERKVASYNTLDDRYKLRDMDYSYYTDPRAKGNDLEGMQSQENVYETSITNYDNTLEELDLFNMYDTPLAAPVAVTNVRMGVSNAFAHTGANPIASSNFSFTLNINDGRITDGTLNYVINGVNYSGTGGTGYWNTIYDTNANTGTGSFEIGNFTGTAQGSTTATTAGITGTMTSGDQSFNIGNGTLTGVGVTTGSIAGGTNLGQ